MSYLSSLITYEDVIRRGALVCLSENAIRRVSNGAPSMTVAAILHLPLDVKVVACAVMHEDVIPGGKMHRVAVGIAENVFDRLTDDKVYLDFRTRRMIAAKRAWIENEISLGELRLAQVKAERAREDVVELNDQRVLAAAELAVIAGDTTPRTAIRSILGIAVEIYDSKEDRQGFTRLIERLLQEGEDD